MRKFGEPKHVCDLVNAQLLYAVCEPCRRQTLLDPRELVRRFGELVTLNEIRARVRCKRCWKRTGTVRVEVEERRRD